MKNLSLKQKFFILLSVFVFIFSISFSAFYGLTNSRIEVVSSVFKLRPYTVIYKSENNSIKQAKRLANNEEHSLEAEQLIDLESITLITPFLTTFTMLDATNLSIQEFVGFFQTSNEINLLLNEYPITIAPDVQGFINTKEAQIYILDGLFDYNGEIVEKNTLIDYENETWSTQNRSELNTDTYTKTLATISEFTEDRINLDFEPPTLVSINLDGLTQTTEAILTINGEAVGAARIFVNNFEVTDKAGQKFSLKQNLRLGDNFIDLRLEDESGNVFEKRFVVTRVTEQKPLSFPN